MNEHLWLKAEQNMARRERVRLIKAKRIRFTSPPNVLVKTESGWRFPSLSVRKDATVKAA